MNHVTHASSLPHHEASLTEEHIPLQNVHHTVLTAGEIIMLGCTVHFIQELAFFVRWM